MEMHGRLMERSISYIDTWYDNNPGQTLDPAELTRMVQGGIDADVSMYGDVQQENPLDTTAQTPELDMAFEAQADEGDLGEDIIVDGNSDEDSDHDEKGGANEYAYKGKTIDEVVNDIFKYEGKPIEELVSDIFAPDVARANIVPMPMGAYREHEGPVQWDNWVTPEAFKALVEMAPKAAKELLKAWMLPGHVIQGGAYTDQDVTNMAGAISISSLSTSIPTGAITSGMTRLRGAPQFMRKVDVEKQGQEAVEKVMRERKSVSQAMFREDAGEITFDYGSPKMGLEHIRSARIAKDNMSEVEAMKFVKLRVPEILAHGRLERIYGPPNSRRMDIIHKDARVYLSLRRSDDQETWVVTGFEDW